MLIVNGCRRLAGRLECGFKDDDDDEGDNDRRRKVVTRGGDRRAMKIMFRKFLFWMKREVTKVAGFVRSDK
ncbi:hypothetical protein Hdeb2414_s0008g00298561 [Helianthus debilis subsp. tardiflorus]